MSHQLHSLIHSLDKQEKRYFKIHNSTFGANETLGEIFDAISSMNSYDEEQIKRKLKDSHALKYLSVNKNKLYHAILDSLIDYHRSHSLYLEARKLSDKIEILTQKNLFQQALLMLKKLEKLAEDNDLTLVKLEVITWYRHLWALINYNGIEEFDLLELERYLENSIHLFDNQMKWRIRSSRVFRLFYASGLAGYLMEKENIGEILNVTEEDIPDDQVSRFVIYNTWGVMAGQEGNYTQSCDHLKKAIASINQSEQIPLHLWNDYISAYNNLIISLAETHKQDEAKSYLKKLKHLNKSQKKITKDAELYLLKHLLALHFFLYLHFGWLESVEELITTMAKGLKKYKFSDWHLAYFHYCAAYLLLIKEKTDGVIDWLNQLLSLKGKSLPDDVLRFGKLLELVAHHQAGNDRLLHDLAERHLRYLNAQSMVFDAEKTLTKSLKKIASTPDKAERNVVYKSALSELKNSLHNDKKEARAMQYFDFDIWLKSQIENASFMDTFIAEKQQRAHG